MKKWALRGLPPGRSCRPRFAGSDDGVAKECEQDRALLLVGGAGHVRIEPASPLLVTGMTVHIPSMQHK